MKIHIRGLVDFLLEYYLLGIGLVTILAFLNKFSWYLDVLCHFRVQYFFISLIITLAFAVFKRRMLVFISLVVVLINFLCILPLYIPQHFGEIENSNPIRVISINVHTSNNKYSSVMNYVKEKNPDILVLEEINKEWVDSLPELKKFKFKIVQTREDNFGIGIYSNIKIIDSKVEHFGEAKLPTIVADMENDSKQFTFIATHPLPPAGERGFKLRNNQFKAISSHRNEFGKSLIVMGDLNTTSWSYGFKDFIKSMNLYDSRKGFGIQPTWRVNSALIEVPIDHCLISNDVKILKREVGDDIGSDHRPILVDLMLGK